MMVYPMRRSIPIDASPLECTMQLIAPSILIASVLLCGLTSACSRPSGPATMQAQARSTTTADGMSAGALLDQRGMPDEKQRSGDMTIWIYRDGSSVERYYLRDHQVVSRTSGTI